MQLDHSALSAFPGSNSVFKNDSVKVSGVIQTQIPKTKSKKALLVEVKINSNNREVFPVLGKSRFQKIKNPILVCAQ